MLRYAFIYFIGYALLSASTGCVSQLKHSFRQNYQEANALLHRVDSLRTQPFLKVHLQNGDVCLFKTTWKLNAAQDTLSGKGVRYDFNRLVVEEGMMQIPADQIVIYETNTVSDLNNTGRGIVVGTLVAVNLVGIALCLSIPKACFGSCPTFYLHEGDDIHYADAEGFSNAIAPNLSYADVDALHNGPLTQPFVDLFMKNEALETHCIQNVELLACPRPQGMRVAHTPDDRFFTYRSIGRMRTARAAEGDISDLLRLDDRRERFAPANPRNLRSSESVIVEFEDLPSVERLGLTLHFRQSLMTTYLIYSAMGYMGDETSDYFSQLISKPHIRNQLKRGIYQQLGGIAVYLWDEDRKRWLYQGDFNETGPIAINRQTLPLKTGQGRDHVRVKLVFNQGLWRLDYLALAELGEPVQAIALKPSALWRHEAPDSMGLALLQDEHQRLITQPGDAYRLRYELPQGMQGDHELFLRSEGYYLEWMREYWLQEKNPVALRRMLVRPNAYLRNEAAKYKRYEANMEEVFWQSKIKSNNTTP